MKKRFILSIIAFLTLIVFLSIEITTKYIIPNNRKTYQDFNIASLDKPTGLIWIDNSTATAKWNAVENANYYIVNVYVYNENNNYINMQETGTTNIEIDLQQEISNIIGGSSFEQLIINFDVQAQYITDSEVIKSDVSNISDDLIIVSQGTIPLNTPTNLTLSDNYIGTWENFDSHSYYYAYFYKIEYNGTVKTGYAKQTITSRYIDVINGKVTKNIKNVLESAYKLAGYNGETVQISFALEACPDILDASYTTSALSDYSNAIEYTSTGTTQLKTPTNLTLSDNYIGTWENFDSHSYYYAYYYKIEYNGTVKTGYAKQTITSRYIDVINGKVTKNIKNVLENAYQLAGYNGETVQISFALEACPDTLDATYTRSALSDYSNFIYYNPGGSTTINQITLSPNNPVIAVGRSIYIGKTINPNDALYSIIRWNSSNNNVVSISNMGQITGVAKGKATITAQINNASQTAEVNVYEIESNVNDEEKSNQLIDEANTVIESVVGESNKNGTDISSINTAINKIESGAQAGNMFNVDFNLDNYIPQNNTLENQIKEKYGDDINIAKYYDVNIELYHTDSNNIKHHIANIIELKNNYNFSLELPNDLPEVPNDKVRVFKTIRNHNNNLDIINSEKDGNNITTSSNKFSDFIIIYEDVDLNFKQPKKYITKDTTKKIIPIIYPLNESNTVDVEWTSSNPEIASIDSKGNITAHQNGTVNITATVGDIIRTVEIEIIDKTIGDITEDGDINLNDVVSILRKIYKYEEKTNTDEKIVDFNGNGEIDLNDVVSLLRFIYKYDDEL